MAMDCSWVHQYPFLQQVQTIIHVGASHGQERKLYDLFKLSVLWIEPIPDIFKLLCTNIASFPKQGAVNFLVTDKDGDHKVLHIASNDGESSSILEWGEHRDHRPDIDYVAHLPMTTITLDTLLKTIDFPPPVDQALVLDTQGSELLVLKGASKNLRKFKFIKTEAWSFEAYKGCTTTGELTDYLAARGFKLINAYQIGDFEKDRLVYDLLFQRVDP